MWLQTLRLGDVHNICAREVELSPSLNVFVGERAQGKTGLRVSASSARPW